MNEGSYPWLAFIVNESGEASFQCTGTVVAPNVVLTAGHCGEDTETGQIDNAADYAVVTGSACGSARRQHAAMDQCCGVCPDAINTEPTNWI